MAGFFLHTSNRLEQLVPVLCDQIKAPRRSVFEPETIIVQSRGMEQWLTQQIAGTNKICSFVEFPFPNAFFNTLLAGSFPDSPEILPFSPELLPWNIYSILPSLLPDPDFGDLRHYLADSKPLRLFELSRKIADLFDQYTMYRPDVVSTWEKGRYDNWQAKLWQKLILSQPSHRQHLGSLFLEKLPELFEKNILPQRVSFFGISALPPFFAMLTEALSNFIDVNYFLLNPCAEFWDDIISDKELRRISRKKHFKKTLPAEELHFESGNTLLASLGIGGRDFLARLHEFECDENFTAIKPASDNLLSAVQNQILTLSSDETAAFKPGDLSIQVHSCHSPMREIEVLHDSILRLFDSIPDLKLSDIVVMAPDISEYATSIHTVFATASAHKLPFTISDQSIRANAEIAQGFTEILDIVNSRFTSIDIVNLLENESVRSAFDISDDDLPVIKSWIRKSQIRWAADPAEKAQLDLPATMENSWEAGLEQLLCGFALPSSDCHLYNGIAGSDLIESNSTAELLGKFLDFFTRLKNFNTMCRKSYTLQDWALLLQKTLSEFFKPAPESLYELNTLNGFLSGLSENGRLAGFSEEVPFEVIRSYLNEKLESSRASRGFLSGSITFCSLLPMRGIPFKIICLLGMNEGVFPRRSHNLSWDMISQSPRRGDRITETEDRYIFLETLLSARNVFYISYLGQSIHNDSQMHPSVCAEELLDYINARFFIKNNDLHTSSHSDASDGKISSHITFRHRLHAFSPSNFIKGSPIQSYRADSFDGARKLIDNKAVKPVFLDKCLPPPKEELLDISINDLAGFFKNPCKYLLNRRLNIFFPDFDEEMKTSEAFDISGLEKYGISGLVLENCLGNDFSDDELQNYYKALNLLPHGSIGSVAFRDLLSDVKEFSGRISNYLNNNKLEDLSVNMRFPCGINLSGQITSLSSECLFLFRQATAKGSDYIDAWIRHIVLNCSDSLTYPKRTVFISRDAELSFNPVADAQAILDDLLALYIRGCSEPLRFFQYSSFEYAQFLYEKNKDQEYAMQQVYKSWHYDNPYRFGSDSEDPYISCALAGQDPLGEDFRIISDKFFKPLFINILQGDNKGDKNAD